jgi:hypothetical protein
MEGDNDTIEVTIQPDEPSNASSQQQAPSFATAAPAPIAERGPAEQPRGDVSDGTAGDRGGARSGLQDRIAQLTARGRGAERERDGALQEVDTLRSALTQTQAQLAALGQRQQAVEQHTLVGIAERDRQAKLAVVDTKLAGLKTERIAALESGDHVKLADLDLQITDVLLDRREAAGAASRPAATPAPAAQTQQVTDPELRSFMTKNSWFGTDKDRTAYAYQVNEQMKARGMPIGDRTYYDTLEQMVKDKFETPAPPPRGGSGASFGTSPAGGRQPVTVKLTRDQVDTATAYGLTPEQYARGVLQAQGRGDKGFETRAA